VDRLRDKVALISGGGGSIGAATARLFAAEGASLVVLDVDEDGLAALTGELCEESAVGIVGDVTNSEQVRAAVTLAVDWFGGLDVAFANAGIFGVPATIAEYPEDVFDQVMAVNVRGSFLLAKHALAAMRDGGSLIFNSSVVGLLSEAGICAYATSKHAIVGLMRTAAKEGARRGIRVNSVHPGPVDNRFQHRIEVDVTGAPEDRAAELFEQNIPLGRHAAPDEIARTVLFLASDESSFITGATLSVDGGMSD
jgi:NAD(P)-dependent dehydrogenase (short-subunit alcohol dehydrogenase family)